MLELEDRGHGARHTAGVGEKKEDFQRPIPGLSHLSQGELRRPLTRHGNHVRMENGRQMP
jgi:hypothetical protein